MVPASEHIHCGVHHEEVESMHRTDVVEDVRVAMRPHQQQHGEVETPQHLHHTQPAEILLHEEKGKVAEPSHPDIASNHDTHTVVDFLRVEVVVEKEDKLHPPLPLFCLLSTQEGQVMVGLDGIEGIQEEDDDHKGEQIS